MKGSGAVNQGTKTKNDTWLQTVVVSSMVLYQLSVRREAQIWDEDTWNWWMLCEGEVYDLGGVPVPQAEELRPWAIFLAGGDAEDGDRQ